MEVPAGEVTVLLGSEPDRRRLLTALADTTSPRPERTRRTPPRRVVSSPALPVVKRVVFLLNAADSDADLVLVDRATEGLSSFDRRFFLDHLRLVAARGAAVVVDDADPVAALAGADCALRAVGGHRPVLTDLDRWPVLTTTSDTTPG